MRAGVKLDSEVVGSGATACRYDVVRTRYELRLNHGQLVQAFKSLTNEYLVTWSGSLSGENDFPSNYEIMGQRLDGGGGGPLGTAIRISDMGPESDNSFRASDGRVRFADDGVF